MNSQFALSSLGGYYVLLAFLPPDAPGRDAALAAMKANRDLFDDKKACGFVVTPDRAEYESEESGTGLRWFVDESGAIADLYGARQGLFVLLDPTQRILNFVDLGQATWMINRLRGLPPAELHAGVEMMAPVLVVPRVLEATLCQQLIDHYNAVGGQPSGVMRQVNGKTVGVLDSFKRRYDAQIQDEALRDALMSRVHHRLVPEIQKAFQFKATRIERYIVARYDAEDGGYFRPHRDNTTSGTAHRKFAVSINLNAEFEGGNLRFPEFGRRTYRPPSGGAVVFSCSLLHEATPVTKGTRYATLPFLYDEEGAGIRAANLHTLAGA